MKKSLFLSISWITLVALTATTLYAQTAIGTSLVDKMKAAAHSFTLSSVLNPTGTGLQSSPIKGKKTGDILTAGEWNRMLELVSEGGSGDGVGWVNVPLTDTTSDFDQQCIYRFQMQWQTYYTHVVSNNRIHWTDYPTPMWFEKTNKSVLVNGIAPYIVSTKLEKLCGGVSGGSGGSSSELQLSNESPTTAPNFIEATKYCKNLTEGGYSDWRFPNLSELFVFAPISTDTNFLWTNAVDYSQWTANANPGYWGKLRMSDGYFSATSGPGDDVAYVRCVRWS
jgi:hypothetical protein